MILTSENDCNQLESSGKIPGSGRKAPEHSEKCKVRNTASMKSLEFPGTDRFLAGVSPLEYNLSMKNCKEKFRKKQM
jgi:hypothetical protein